MSREILIVLIGFTIILLPHLGVPVDLKNILFSGSGILLVLLGISLRRTRYLRSISDKRGGLHGNSFRESSASAPFKTSASLSKDV